MCSLALMDRCAMVGQRARVSPCRSGSWGRVMVKGLTVAGGAGVESLGVAADLVALDAMFERV